MAKKKNYNELLSTPFETRIKNFPQVAKYFLYYAPNVDSAQSPGKIEGEKAQAVFNSMISQAGLTKKYKIVKRIKSGVWKDHQLDDEKLDFEMARFTCDQYGNESELNAILRHVRNALAHGYIYVWKKKNGNYVFLIDYDTGKKKITAKMMLSMKILECWKAILENQIATGE